MILPCAGKAASFADMVMLAFGICALAGLGISSGIRRHASSSRRLGRWNSLPVRQYRIDMCIEFSTFGLQSCHKVRMSAQGTPVPILCRAAKGLLASLDIVYLPLFLIAQGTYRFR